MAIKIYRTSERPLDAKDSIMTDIIIGLIISQNGLGPKIYGIPPDSVIMEYIKVLIFVNYFKEMVIINILCLVPSV